MDSLRGAYRCYTCKINKESSQFYLVHGRVSQNECRPCSSTRRARDYRKDPEKYRIKRMAYARAHKKETALYHRNWRWRLKLEVLAAYGGVCACPGCNQRTVEFLSIEHPGGGGRKERLRLRTSGTAFYSFLKRNGFPRKYKILCFNCNCSNGFYGYCPHVITDSQEKTRITLPAKIIGKRKTGKYYRANRPPLLVSRHFTNQ